jgi:hypothetical protein
MLPPLQVNFVIAGVMRGGTTALAHFLSQHSEICFAPAKETHFFDDPDFDDQADYEEILRRYALHFPNFEGQPLVGEATPIYLYFPHVIERLARYNPEMKFILLLRDPVSRAISHFNHSKVHNFEKRSLMGALLFEKVRLLRDRKNWAWTSSLRRHSYLDRGFYGKQIAMLLQHFPARQVCLVNTHDLRDQHDSVLRRIHHFLGLTQRMEPTVPEVLNVFGEPTIPDFLYAGLKSMYNRDQSLLVKLTELHKINI